MTPFDDKPEFTPDELTAEFAALFPQGWAGADVFAELAPRGWEASPLTAVCHPSARQQYEEQLRFHRNLANFPLRKPDAPPPPPEPTLAEIEAGYEPSPVEPERECRELVGQCLWDIFSDNHEVVAEDGRWLHLGSARGSGGFLADVLNAQPGPPPAPRPEMPPDLMARMFPSTEGMDPKVAEIMEEMRREMIGDGGYTYLDFYMGTHAVAERADLRPVYEMIFRRLKARGHDWEYHFPRIGLVDFRPLKKQLDEQARREKGESEFEGYDPSAAFEEEQEEQKRDEEIAAMRESLDEGHREAVAAALEEEPPATVQAYRAVYGDFPQGWPPEVDE